MRKINFSKRKIREAEMWLKDILFGEYPALRPTPKAKGQK
ncbi:MAG: hypothetical protein A4E71_02978 [Smithella sp. PtaU1.Bin162]|nr:MAG: hypothetical protein A4E71_02978 [Smithella sp. PtaU1.Bin162]